MRIVHCGRRTMELMACLHREHSGMSATLVWLFNQNRSQTMQFMCRQRASKFNVVFRRLDLPARSQLKAKCLALKASLQNRLARMTQLMQKCEKVLARWARSALKLCCHYCAPSWACYCCENYTRFVIGLIIFVYIYDGWPLSASPAAVSGVNYNC